MDSASFDPTWIFLSLIPGGIGFVLLVYGKKQQRWPHIVGGLAMMVYPYFTSTITAMALVGISICVALWYVVRLGY
jgi:hypothetical protein